MTFYLRAQNNVLSFSRILVSFKGLSQIFEPLVKQPIDSCGSQLLYK